VDLPLASTILKQMLGQPVELADIEELDSALFR
jgi:hypothetical protein